jgi:hypothetical protein
MVLCAGQTVVGFDTLSLSQKPNYVRHHSRKILSPFLRAFAAEREGKEKTFDQIFCLLCRQLYYVLIEKGCEKLAGFISRNVVLLSPG